MFIFGNVQSNVDRQQGFRIHIRSQITALTLKTYDF
jgi:hypothetical protein